VDPDDEMIPVHNSAGRDPLIEKAASIVVPVLRAKKVTAKMIHVMLEEILKTRKTPDFVAQSQSAGGKARARALIWRHGGPVYGADPADPGVIIEHHRDGTQRRGHFVGGKFVPLDPTVFDKIRAFRSRQKPLPPGEAKKLIRAGRHRLRRRRVLSPKFKKLMAKKTAGSTQADLDAVRGDR
jgi:hypothetical protein